MASVRRRDKSRYWYACITMPDGSRRQFSTGLEDEQEALAAAVAVERATRKQPTPERLRIALERVAEDFAPESTEQPGPWLSAWMASRKREVAASTFDKYRVAIDEAVAFLTDHAITSFSAITPSLVTKLRDEWAERQAPGTANGKVKVLRMAFEQARREKLLDTNPAEQVARLRIGAGKRREFRPAELEILIPTLAGEWRALFFLGLYTGQRLNDLANLEWRQLDLEAGTITFTAGKTGATVALPLVGQAVDALAELPSADDPAAAVFPRIRAKRPGSRSNEFRKLLAAVGLAKPPKEKANTTGRRAPQELSFHSLRHTATSMLKAAGVSDSIARAIIGHESSAVSRIYTHLDLDTMREAMNKMPKV